MTDQKKSAIAVDELPTPQDFCLTVPLYEIFRFDNEKSNPFFAIEHFKGPLDVYCTECGRHSVFKLMHEVSNYTVVSPMFAPNDDPPCSSRDACQT